MVLLDTMTSKDLRGGLTAEQGLVLYRFPVRDCNIVESCFRDRQHRPNFGFAADGLRLRIDDPFCIHNPSNVLDYTAGA